MEYHHSPHLQEAQSHSTWWPHENWYELKAPWAQNDTSWGSDVPERKHFHCWDTAAKSQSSVLKISGSQPSHASESPGGLVKIEGGPSFPDFWCKRCGVGPRVWSSNKFPGDAKSCWCGAAHTWRATVGRDDYEVSWLERDEAPTFKKLPEVY